MNSFLKSILVLGCGICGVVIVAAEPEAKTSILMSKKLEYSQNLLKALTTEDYEQAEHNIRLMQTFTRLEEIYRGERPEYRRQFKNFQTSISDLSQAVDEKNLDQATKAYLDMVQSCIKCHSELRRK